MDDKKIERNRENETDFEGKNEKTEMRIDNNPDRVDLSETTEKIKKNPWMLVSIVLGIVVIILLFFNPVKGVTGNVVAGEDAGEKIVEYLNTRTGGGVEYLSFEDAGSLYEVTVAYNGDEVPVFVTKDGEYFVQGAIPISETAAPNSPQAAQSQPAKVVKSDKPEVELFVMTHCPYGTQAEKGIIPVLELLGDKIEGGIKFVHYFMHDPEKEETPIQVCIREEQSEKYLDYLKCFLEAGDSESCQSKVGINKAQLNSCIKGKSEDYYAADSELSNKYGVQGSPTLVINGQIVSSGRDSASYLATICSAFNNAPEECNEELSSASPSPGFGYSATNAGSAASAAQCG